MLTSSQVQDGSDPTEIVSSFFARLDALLDRVNAVELDRHDIDAYLQRPDLRDAHILAAFTDPDGYISVVEDLLTTATKLSVQSSPVAEELLVDWITTSPQFALERLRPDTWNPSVGEMAESWKAAAE